MYDDVYVRYAVGILDDVEHRDAILKNIVEPHRAAILSLVTA